MRAQNTLVVYIVTLIQVEIKNEKTLPKKKKRAKWNIRLKSLPFYFLLILYGSQGMQGTICALPKLHDKGGWVSMLKGFAGQREACWPS